MGISAMEAKLYLAILIVFCIAWGLVEILRYILIRINPIKYEDVSHIAYGFRMAFLTFSIISAVTYCVYLIFNLL